MIKGVDAFFFGFGVLINQQFHARIFGGLVAQFVHLLEFPSGVHMQQWKGGRRWIKRFFRQMQHHGAVFAHGIEHDGIFRLGHNLAHDVNGFGLKPF